MEYCSFAAVCTGKINIILPVFSGESGAQNMNLFYSRAAEMIYNYAELLCQEKFTRFCCDYDICGEDKLEVKLILSFHRRGERALRREIIHVWQEGYILSRKILK